MADTETHELPCLEEEALLAGAGRPTTIAVLEERVNNAIRLAWAFAALVALVAGFLVVKVLDHGERLAVIETKLGRIQGDVTDIKRELRELRLLSSVRSSEGLAAVPGILAEAKAQSAPIDTRTIQQADGDIVRAMGGDASDPNLWRAAASLIN